MIYNTQIEIDKKKAIAKFKMLIENNKTFELKEKHPKRSISQNNYLHLILSWFALEYGESLQYTKQVIFKKDVNQDIFQYEFINRITGEIRIDYRSTSDLDTKEMTIAIDRFRDYAAKGGIYLPEPKDLSILEYIEIQVNNNKHFI